VSEPRAAAQPEGLEPFESFLSRHVGTSDEEQTGMLKVLGYESLDALINAAVPDGVRSLAGLDLPPAATERVVLDELRELASRNVLAEPMIGLGYSGTCWRARPGTPRTPRTNPRSARVAWRRC
jgi:glycine cleavage system pyridoxal-binding protein P